MSGIFRIDRTLIHVTGISVLLLVFRESIRLLACSVDLPSNLSALYLWILPLMLVFQSVVLSLILPGRKLHSIALIMDFLTVLAIQVSSVLILSFSTQGHLLSMSGLLIAIATFIRTVLLIGSIARFCRKVPGRSLYLAAAVLFLMLPVASWRHSVRPLMGDEPYYLLIAGSLIDDHDIDLANNYDNGDSLAFTDRRLVPQSFDSWMNGKLLSRHPPFLPLMLIPGLFLLNAQGALFTMVIFAAMLASGLFHLLMKFDIPRDWAVWISVLIVMTAPVCFYSVAIFAELPGAVLGVSALSAALNIQRRKGYPVLTGILLASAAAALKTRFVLLCFPPIIISLLMRSRWKRTTWIWVGSIPVILIMIGFINSCWYGSPLGRYVVSEFLGISGWRMFRGLFGIFLDQQYGLLPMNPLYLLAIPGTISMYRSIEKSRFLIWLSAWVPSFLAIALYSELTGGICPKGRFLVAWVPLLAIPAARLVCRAPSGTLSSTSVLLLIASVTHTVLMFVNLQLQIIFPGSVDSLLGDLSKSIRMDLLGIFPSFDRVESGLVRVTVILSVCILFFAIMVLISLRRIAAPSMRTSHLHIQPGILWLLAGTVSAIFLLTRTQSTWMHTEDPVFSEEGSARLFWEEPRRWDDWLTPEPSPYRSGMRLHPEASLTRSIPLRYPVLLREGPDAVEISARGSYPGQIVPVLEVSAGDRVLGRARMRSDHFESYILPWPYGSLENIPALNLRFRGQDLPDTYIDIDKIRLIEWDRPWPVDPNRTRGLFPVTFGPLTIESMFLPETPLKQGVEFTPLIRKTASGTTEDLQFALLFLSETKAFIASIPIDATQNEFSIPITIPPASGTGDFEVLAQVRRIDTSEFLAPEGSSIFTSGKRAWVGRIHIDPVAIPAGDEWRDIMISKTGISPDKLHHVHQVCHLSRDSEISIQLEHPVMARGVIVISHLSSVFEEIPWRTPIGCIEVSGIDGNQRYDMILGRDTAEEMYEFGGKTVRLAHPQAPIAARIPKTISWPIELEGMAYDSVYYYSMTESDHAVPVQSIRIQAMEFPGVWNIYALALVQP